MRSSAGAIVAALLALASLSSASAQQASPFCFRGKPLPNCARFALVELTGGGLVASSAPSTGRAGPPGPSPRDFGGEVGVMFNRDSTHALGATIGGATSEAGARASVAIRHRTWMTSDAFPPGSYRDVSVGLVASREYAGPSTGLRSSAYGVSTEITAGVGDVAGAWGGGELLLGNGKPIASLRVGLCLGSWAALAGLLLAGIAAVAIVGGEKT